MNDFSRPYGGAPSMDMSTDAGLRSYMLGIYNTMMIGLAVTGGIGIVAANAFFVGVGTPGFGVTELGATIFNSPLRWVVMLAPLAMVFVISGGVNKFSSGVSNILFYVFAALMGVSISSIFAVYTSASVVNTFFVTAAAFGGLSLYGYTTKKNLKAMGSFMLMGLFGIIIASVVNIFLGSGAVEFGISVLGVLIFAGLTAWDTQRLKTMYYQLGGDGEMARRVQIQGALSLYLNFLNMFLFLLRLFGSRD
jgi:FtsH-binding integral membrane protein